MVKVDLIHLVEEEVEEADHPFHLGVVEAEADLMIQAWVAEGVDQRKKVEEVSDVKLLEARAEVHYFDLEEAVERILVHLWVVMVVVQHARLMCLVRVAEEELDHEKEVVVEQLLFDLQ